MLQHGKYNHLVDDLTPILPLPQPPASGDYVFYLASDDESELWLSTDEDKGNVRKLAELKEAKKTGHTGYQQWNK